MKHLFTLQTYLFFFLCFAFFSCETEQQVEQNAVILEDPLYLEYDKVYQTLSVFVTSDKIRRIKNTIDGCDINNDDVCTIIRSECVRKNQEAIDYYNHHCRMMSLREALKEKYQLSNDDFVELYIQDIKSRMISQPYES